ncbi:hypothetical protein J7399_01825 [Shimia sp. R9_1]|uniref:DUF6455 family protein n=1 Tax=unclassified Shimia TaxID=2630038 RepID=UPI001ADC35B5|nr:MULTISPECIES: DUF6455 family protein [unclassified Shimia]MBO9396306.1 hypothetical protein [Shimia sp. R9_2]MBO9400550.1 hypothetical protein [Shimia sp. R9_3]MBO9406151.1 hypothetical protein [Shimia sp. R9_1]
MGVVVPLGDPATHFWLTRSMGRKMGVSLSEMMAEGRLSVQEYTGMVTRCRTCAHVAECQSWLGEAGQHKTPPEFCCHAALMARLAPH